MRRRAGTRPCGDGWQPISGRRRGRRRPARSAAGRCRSAPGRSRSAAAARCTWVGEAIDVDVGPLELGEDLLELGQRRRVAGGDRPVRFGLLIVLLSSLSRCTVACSTLLSATPVANVVTRTSPAARSAADVIARPSASRVMLHPRASVFTGSTRRTWLSSPPRWRTSRVEARPGAAPSVGAGDVRSGPRRGRRLGRRRTRTLAARWCSRSSLRSTADVVRDRDRARELADVLIGTIDDARRRARRSPPRPLGLRHELADALDQRSGARRRRLERACARPRRRPSGRSRARDR